MVMGDLVREVDVAIVGGGPGGYSAAFRCAELGLETVVIDADKRLGGICLYDGCIPSKALLHVAAVIHEVERARDYGLEFGERRVALETVRAWKTERVIGKLAKGLASVAKARGVEVIGGQAVFADSRRLRVEGEEPQIVRFRHAIVATGSLPSRPPGITLESDRVMDSSAALELSDVPERLLVIGGGYVGLEIGTIYAALGSAVTLVEMTEGLLPGVDRDLVQPVTRRVEKLFRAVHLNTKVTDLRETGSVIEVDVSGQGTHTVDRVLIAVGRRAQSDGLGLPATRVRLDDRGVIAVDQRCRTEEPRIYAVGDVTGEPMLAHRAIRQGKIAAEAIAGRPVAFDNVAVPAVVFTDPEIAWCGLTEHEAQRAGRPVRIAKFSWAASGRAASLGRADGLTKLVADPESGRLLGVGIVGPGAGELIGEATVAIECGLLAEDIAATIHVHPTLAETLMEAAESLGFGTLSGQSGEGAKGAKRPYDEGAR
jgi:dihydrolipoamide dehydrogenase